MKIIGHRGAAGLAMENTISSLAKAIELGVSCVEIDVWQISTGELIVFHDAYLDRLTTKTGYTSSLNHNDLTDLRLTNGEPIPQLSEVIEFARSNNLQLIVEVKNEAAFQKAYEALKNSMGYEDYVIGSFFHQGIMDLKQHDSNLQTSIMFEGVPVQLDSYLQLVNPDYVTISADTYNQYLTDIVKNQNRKLLFYTVNTHPEFKLLQQVQPYGIITNHPDLFL